jgi:hypothetical protein
MRKSSIMHNTKFLGMWLDKNLRWSTHTQKLANKLCKIHSTLGYTGGGLTGAFF